MCGHHRADGTPVAHEHDDRPVFHPKKRQSSVRLQHNPLQRRAFLGDVGKGTLAFAILGPALAACGGDNASSTTTTSSAASSGPSEGPGSPTSTSTPAAGDTAEDTELQWTRADLGFVSAYVLARGTEAAIVDTGTAGSADAIGTTLAELGLDYSHVGHVILTHYHGDHAGSIGEVLAMAEGATGYAGEGDLARLDGSMVTGVKGGAEVFGMEIIDTPGHTPGHISVIDHTAGLFIAGDAIVTQAGGVQGPPEQFTEDLDMAHESVRTIASLTFNTLLVGHGDPIEDMADTAVAALADSL